MTDHCITYPGHVRVVLDLDVFDLAVLLEEFAQIVLAHICADALHCHLHLYTHHSMSERMCDMHDDDDDCEQEEE